MEGADMAEAKKRAPRKAASKPETPERAERETAATTTRPTDEVQVRFLCAVAGPGFRYRRKQVVAMTEAEADVWCDGIRAERV